jgi:hypothetical protein
MMKYPSAKRRSELAIQFAKAHPHYKVLKNGNILYNKPNDKWWMWPIRNPAKFGKRLVEAGIIFRNGGKGTHWYLKPPNPKTKTTETNK